MSVNLKSMIKRSVFLLMLCFFCHAGATEILCPHNKDFNGLMDKAISLNSDGKKKEAIIILQKLIDLSKTINCKDGELVATKNMMLVYSQISDYEKALEISDKVKELAIDQKNYKTLTTLYTTRSTLYEYLGLYDESLKESETALQYARQIPDADTRHFQLSLLYYNLAPNYQDKSNEKALDYLLKSREEIAQVKDNSQEISFAKKMDMLVSVNMNLGIYYVDKKNEKHDLKLAEFYYNEALKLTDHKDAEIGPNTRIDLFQALQEFYKAKKDYKRSVEYGQNMLALEKSNSMPYNRRVGYMVLAKSYLEVGDSQNSKKYLDLYTKLNDSIIAIEKESVEIPIKNIISETKTSSKKEIKKIIIISAVIILFVVLGFLIYRRRSNKILHEKYQALIDKLKTEQKEHLPEDIGKEKDRIDLVKSSNAISDETQKSLLIKLKKFENSERYLKKDISLAWLSNQLNTNTKYLSEIINNDRNKNFSNYINGLRIDYITRKLYEYPVYRDYKISYLAEECGYASSQVFVIAFKKETGVTPSYFIAKLKQQSKVETA